MDDLKERIAKFPDSELKTLLIEMPDSYDDFVAAILDYAYDDEEKTEDVINFIKDTENVTTSDVIKFITPFLLAEQEEEKEKAYTGEFRENCLEWLNGQDVITCTISQKKFRNKLLKMAELYPDDVKIEAMNDGVTILVKIPLKYLSIRKPRELSEEEKRKAAERLKAFRKTKKD